MANCWVTGGKCPYGFEEGILSARMSFCGGCAHFSLNSEETEDKLRDLWIKKDVIISETDQLEICEHADRMHLLVVEKMSNLGTAIRQGRIKVGDKEDANEEMGILEVLKNIFYELA